MWTDNETTKDFLNFTGVAETVSELIVQAEGQPVSIGVSGAWGVGKTSMIRMVRQALEERDEEETKKFIYVEFDAWLYQNHDDARAALLEVIATKLVEEAEKRQTTGTQAVEKATDFLKRVDWFRTAKVAASAAGMLAGIPPVMLAGEALQIGKRLTSGDISADDVQKASEAIDTINEKARGVLKPPADQSPPKQIHDLRVSFEETLEEMGVTLVVLIDDLDRCLPETTISTLEAVRLFLFLENTAFVIAADDEMIKHAVRKHFDNVDDEHVTNYFDKLIQIPIRVPSLGTQEVRAYLMLLFVENSSLADDKKELIRAEVCEQLSGSWQGKRVDSAFIKSVESNLPTELVARLDTADRLAPIMTTASGIKGNPRLIKRFLNAFAIRTTIARTHGIDIDEGALVKMLLFERCASAGAYTELATSAMKDEGGKPRILDEWEAKATKGEELELSQSWDTPFIHEWLTLPPQLAEHDLRGILYVSREHAPLISPEDNLSSEGAELLIAVLDQPDTSSSLKDRLTALPRNETHIIMDRVLQKAQQEPEWGTPSILEAALVLCEADSSQGERLGAFLSDRPSPQIKPSIVPKIKDHTWASEVFDKWNSSDVSQPVKNAIASSNKSK